MYNLKALLPLLLLPKLVMRGMREAGAAMDGSPKVIKKNWRDLGIFRVLEDQRC